MKREVSAGGIVYRKAGKDPNDACEQESMIRQRTSGERKIKKDDEIYILMIRDHNNKWTFPKGHIEKGEKPQQAAIREVEEETGIKAEIIAPVGEIKYFFVLEGEKIFKIVNFYLMKTDQIDFKIQWEIKGAEWFSPDKALDIISSGKESYKNQLAVLQIAVEKIKELSSKKSLKDF